MAIDPRERTLDGGRTHIDALDSVRALLMLLGVWIHAAAPYRDRAPWLVDDADGSALLGLSSEWLAEFRMPAFFFLAGLLGAWAFEARGSAAFLARRTLRLALPLIVGVLTLNALQANLLSRYAEGHCTVAAACAVNLTPAPWLGHLWFLLDLLLYTALLVVGWAGVRRVARAIDGLLDRRAGRLGLIGFVAALLFAAAAWQLAVGSVTLLLPSLRVPWQGFWSFTWVAQHAFYFFAGAALSQVARFQAALAQPVPLSATLRLGAIGTVAFAAWELFEPGRASITDKIVYASASVIPTVLLAVFAICAGLTLHSRLAGLVRAAARYSYSIYLVHHIVVVVTALALLALPIAGPAKFAITLTVAFAVALGAAMVIDRVSWLALLFNGRGTSVRATAASPPAVAPSRIPGLESHPDAVTLFAPVPGAESAPGSAALGRGDTPGADDRQRAAS